MIKSGHPLIGAVVGGTTVLSRSKNVDDRVRLLCRCPCGGEFSTRAQRVYAAKRCDGLVLCHRCARLAAAKTTAIVKKTARENPRAAKISPYERKRQAREAWLATVGLAAPGALAAGDVQPERPPNPNAVTRACVDCAKPKELTTEFFPVKKSSTGKPYFLRQCRECRRLKDKAELALLRAGVPAKKGTPFTMKGCATCGGMSWRVPGIKCPGPGCGLRYKAEAKPELQLRTFERAV